MNKSIYDLEVEAYAINKAITMARDKAVRFNRAVYRYRILDNPMNEKKMSVIWHNAFYAECKKLGRRSR